MSENGCARGLAGRTGCSAVAHSRLRLRVPGGAACGITHCRITGQWEGKWEGRNRDYYLRRNGLS
eukprot:8877696-Heterocapsa_arctica.AAC.1